MSPEIARLLVEALGQTLYMVAAAGLDMIRRQLLGIEQQPRYFQQRRAR